MADLRNIPAIRAEAEAEARVRQDGLANRWPSMDDCPPPTWASMAPAERAFLVDVELDLLCDLSRPASRDAVARLVAARVGLVCGATAPTLLRIKGVGSGTIWSLSVRSDTDMSKSPSVTIDQRVFVEPNVFPDSPLSTVVPRISVITDPTEALRLIALHVLGADHD